MPRDRLPVDFRPEPLAREREGCRLTERPITARMAEVVSRLTRAAEAAMPRLTDTEWSLVCWAGWSAIESERVLARSRPQGNPPESVDVMAWQTIVAEAAEREDDVPGLAMRLHDMSQVERIAVLERIEAYGRAEAMR